MPPVFKALCAQLGSLTLLFIVGRSGVLPALSPLELAGLQGLLAVFLALSFRSARWWLPIHLLFMPAIVMGTGSGLPVWFYGLSFAALALIYWSSFRTQVPLFLSNKITVHRFATHLPDTQCLRILDVGSGTGSFVRRLARLRPDWQIEGIETAPAPSWLAQRLSRRLVNTRLVRGDFWRSSLRDFDVVYAFLSPVPMPALWAKAIREMPPGSLLVSNSFEVAGVQPTRVLDVDDRRRTRLYYYRIPGNDARAHASK